MKTNGTKENVHDSAAKESRGKWLWKVRIDFVRYTEKEGVPLVLGYFPIPAFLTIYTGEKQQEYELIDRLTTNRGAYGLMSDSPLFKALHNYRDGVYRLVVYKQTVIGRANNLPLTAFWGYCFIEKRKDKIFWRSRYFQQGRPDKNNMDFRDPHEETHRKHDHERPSGGIDFVW